MSFVCAIPLIASLFSACAEPGPLAVGYVEGEYVLIAPIEIAEIRSVSVVRVVADVADVAGAASLAGTASSLNAPCRCACCTSRPISRRKVK